MEPLRTPSRMDSKRNQGSSRFHTRRLPVVLGLRSAAMRSPSLSPLRGTVLRWSVPICAASRLTGGDDGDFVRLEFFEFRDGGGEGFGPGDGLMMRHRRDAGAP